MVDGTGLKNLIAEYRPGTDMSSSGQVRRAILPYKDKLQKKLMATLQKTCEYGSVTLDAWSIVAGKSYLGVTFHWIEQRFHPHETVLALEILPYPHDRSMIRGARGMYCINFQYA